MNTYGNSWKTPAVDQMLKTQHGGATMQRFYSKFPIYRERKDKPDVTDNIQGIWDETVARCSVAPGGSTKLADRRGSYQQSIVDSFHNYQEHVAQGGSGRITPVRQHRSKSIAKKSDQMRSLQLMEKSGLVVPTRERFNEDAGRTIEDMRS